ncbi:hypothetical protein EV715DRAFT_296988 [Schizophyllum commune]
MDPTHYQRCTDIVVSFLAADDSVRLNMVKHSLDDFLLFARNSAPKDSGFRAMLVAVVKGLQDCYARGVTDGALLYLSEHPNGLDEADRWQRVPGQDVYDHGHLEDVELMARAVGYPVHELKDLFVELGVPGQPGYPRDTPYIPAGHPPSAAPEYAARAPDPTVAGSETRAGGQTGIHNFCRVVIGDRSPDRHPSPTISEQEREYVEEGGSGLGARHAPYALTPVSPPTLVVALLRPAKGCPDCVRAGSRCIPTTKCCFRCDGVDIRQALPSSQARLVDNINDSVQSIFSSTNSANAALRRLEGLGPALRHAQSSVQALTDAVRGTAEGR